MFAIRHCGSLTTESCVLMLSEQSNALTVQTLAES